MNFELCPEKTKISRANAPHQIAQNAQFPSEIGNPAGGSSISPPRYSIARLHHSSVVMLVSALSKEKPPEKENRRMHVHAEESPSQIHCHKRQRPGSNLRPARQRFGHRTNPPPRPPDRQHHAVQ